MNIYKSLVDFLGASVTIHPKISLDWIQIKDGIQGFFFH